jgi:hypothetical protein
MVESEENSKYCNEKLFFFDYHTSKIADYNTASSTARSCRTESVCLVHRWAYSYYNSSNAQTASG